MLKLTPTKRGDGVRVHFVLPEERVAGRVWVIGEFNDWEAGATPLRRRTDGTWSASVVLEPGRRYAFRYLGEGGRWYDEETADSAEPNGLGSWNSVVQT